MKDAMEFEMLLDDVLREVANPEPETGLMQRVMLPVEKTLALERYETAQASLFEGELKQEWSLKVDLEWIAGAGFTEYGASAGA